MYYTLASGGGKTDNLLNSSMAGHDGGQAYSGPTAVQVGAGIAATDLGPGLSRVHMHE